MKDVVDLKTFIKECQRIAKTLNGDKTALDEYLAGKEVITGFKGMSVFKVGESAVLISCSLQVNKKKEVSALLKIRVKPD